MESRNPHPDQPDLQEIEWEMRQSRWDLTAGRLVFDLLFGIAAPVVLFVANEGVFRAPLGERPAVPPYWADLTYVAAGCVLVGLLLWLLTGARRPVLGVLLAGPFALGALLSAWLGLRLLEFAFVHVAALQGALGFTPWFTAYVFARHSLRAVRAGADRSPAVAGVALVISAALLAVLLGGLALTAARHAADLELRLFSKDPADQADAIARVARTRAVDFDRVADIYAAERKTLGPHLQKVASVYLLCTGEAIDDAVQRRLRPGQPRPKPEAKVETAEEKLGRLLDGLFSDDVRIAQKSADELTGMTDVDYEPVVRRYRRLRDDDPIKARVKEAFPGLSGQTIDLAVKRLEEREKREAQDRLPAAEAP